MKKIRYTILSVLMVALFLLPFNFAQAKTLVSEVDNGDYQVIVKIAFDFADKNSALQAGSLMLRWQKGMRQIWPEQKINNSDSLIKYQFQLLKIEPGTTCADYPDYHCINVTSNKLNVRGNVADSLITLPNSSQNSWGEWTTRTTGLKAAHEVGHMMGLADEYHYELKNEQRIWVNDNYQQNGFQSIMAQTWDAPVALPEYGLKIIEKLGFNSPNLRQ